MANAKKPRLSRDEATPFDQLCAELFGELLANKEVSFDTFRTKFRTLTRWSYACNALAGFIEHFRGAVKKEKGRLRLVKEPSKDFVATPLFLATEHFKTYEDVEAKLRIGATVALYLKSREETHVLLGSGSTVYHAGVQMREVARVVGPYLQQFWTFNPVLVAEWCREANSPVDQVHILQGVVSTKTSRYIQVKPHKAPFPVFVLGADGVHFAGGEAWLFAHDPFVAEMSNQLIGKAADAVICCLTSKKLAVREGDRHNVSDYIEAPEQVAGGAARYLVTDRPPQPLDNSMAPKTGDHAGSDQKLSGKRRTAAETLVASGWKIISSPWEFDEVNRYLTQLKEGDEKERKQHAQILNYLQGLGIEPPAPAEEPSRVGQRKERATTPSSGAEQ